jgi:hypothetical protein
MIKVSAIVGCPVLSSSVSDFFHSRKQGNLLYLGEIMPGLTLPGLAAQAPLNDQQGCIYGTTFRA